MKVLVTGSRGQLGRALRRAAPEWAELVPMGRDSLDITDAGMLSAVLEEHRPELVINAAAYTRVDDAETHRDLAFDVNATAPRALAEKIAVLGTRLIHVSTDFVFPGDVPLPRSPNDATGPLSVYGASKLSGEVAVHEALGSSSTIVRTSWLYSSDGTNFLTTMLRLMSSRDCLRVIFDQVGAPTSSQSLAEAIWKFAEMPQVTGTHHWTDDGVASWYDFAVAIQEEAVARGLLESPIRIEPIRTKDYPTPAQRPAYSVLDKSVTCSELGFRPDHWRANLRKVLDDLSAR